MHINLCSMNQFHSSGFSVKRENGSGDYLYIFTRAPLIVSVDGHEVKYPARTVIFFHKDVPQHYMTAGSSCANDYLHFDTDSEQEETFIKSLGIPYPMVAMQLDPTVLFNVHHLLGVEHASDDPNRDGAVDALLKYFLIKLGQLIRENTADARSMAIRTKLNTLRQEIYGNPEKDWSISVLAAKTDLSESYFQSLYRQQFQCSAIADVITARLEKAKKYLTATEEPVGAVARFCGYDNESHFSRQFKQLIGVSPKEYRRINR